jgi:hypothetical protein
VCGAVSGSKPTRYAIEWAFEVADAEGSGCGVDDGERSVRARRLRAAGVEWRPRVLATKKV